MIIAEDKICIQLKDEYGSTWIWKCGFPNISFAASDAWWNISRDELVNYTGNDNRITRVKEWLNGI